VSEVFSQQTNWSKSVKLLLSIKSALAKKPNVKNDRTIKKWGRWKSNAFERYTRLNHIAKKAMIEKFVKALEM
jgi:hypothetical protein